VRKIIPKRQRINEMGDIGETEFPKLTTASQRTGLDKKMIRAGELIYTS
jgi:hypothetical protein